MHIKKYEALNVSDALRAIKEDLGPDAIILSTKEIRKDKGVFGVFGRPMVEVTAAVDRPAVTATTVEAPAPEFASALYAAQQPEPPASDVGAVHKELRAIREAVSALHGSLTFGPLRQMAGIQETWIDMKGVLGVMLTAQEVCERQGAPEPLTSLVDRLREGGLDQDSVVGLLRAVKQKLSADALWHRDAVRACLFELVQGMVETAGPVECGGTRPKVVALVGPTGVGKTTTIAKLAAHQFRDHGRVTLATLDTYRIGAVEQLKIYAKIIGVPVEVAASGRELRDIVARRSPGDVVLVDTAGRSHLGGAQLDELKDLTRVGVPVETHLVVAANTKESELDAIVDRFSVIPIDRLLISKTDETQTYGALVSTIKKTRKPVSYLTTGQRVPEDIETATPHRVAELVFGTN
ncbi:MAG: flagellar biosynthesis protein FlhF [Nitrospirota bacterium]